MSFFVTKIVDKWGTSYSMTTAGYTALIILMLSLFAGIGFATNKRSKQKSLDTKQLVFSGAAVALAMVTSMIKLLDLPMGGSVTLFSMLFICLVGYWYGIKIGIMTGLAYGILQLITDPYIISFPQMFLDYIFAFSALGLSGLFAHAKNGLVKGYFLGVIGRYFCSVLSGVIFFGIYAADYGMSPLAYSLTYNGLCIGTEGIITLVILAIPSVTHAFSQVKRIAVSKA